MSLLAQVETLLNTHDGPDSTPRQPSPAQENSGQQLPDIPLPDSDTGGGNLPHLSSQPNILPDVFENQQNTGFVGLGSSNNDFSWEMIGLGLEEPLPTQEVIDELYVLPNPRDTPFESD